MVGPFPRSSGTRTFWFVRDFPSFSTNPGQPGAVGHPALVSKLVNGRVKAGTLLFPTQSLRMLSTALKRHPLHRAPPVSYSKQQLGGRTARWSLSFASDPLGGGSAASPAPQACVSPAAQADSPPLPGPLTPPGDTL